jgi:hypothetical protein
LSIHSGPAIGVDIILSEDSSSDSSSDEHPGTIVEDTPDREDQLEWSEDEEQDNVPEQPRLDLAYSAEFNILSELAAVSDSLEELDPRPVDVDRWELVITPDEYLQRFKDTLSTVQLINRLPLRRLHTTYHGGPAFDKWMLLAQANHQLWIHPRYKDAFVTALEEHQTVQPGTLPLQASLGSVHVSTTVFIHCLKESGCDTIRLKTYGQKTPLEARFISHEPAQVNHRWAEHNEWDIGQSFTSPHVWLFHSSVGRRHGLKHYPMLVPGSGNFGTVNITSTYQGRQFKIKIYPRLVHVIKSFNSRLQGSVPRTLQGVRNQVASAQRMVHSLISKNPTALGGFRIEVTVRAKSLKDAHRLVSATNFLKPEYWLHTGDGPHARQGLTAQLVSKDGLLANANWVYNQATEANMFVGAASDRPSKEQIQAIVDILNALGWNAGIRSPSKSLDPDAWWHSTPSTDRAAIYQELLERHQTDQQIRALFDRAREAGPHYGLPCKSEPGNSNHRYQVHNKSPFRVRCANLECGSKLQRTALIHWISELVQGAVLNADVLEE